MSRVLIIGAGGVENMVARTCARLPTVGTDVCLASRTVSKREEIAEGMGLPWPLEIPQ